MNPSDNDEKLTYYQYSSNLSSIKKGIIKYSLQSYPDVVLLESLKDNEVKTRFVFSSECSKWNSGVSDITRCKVTIEDIRSIQQDGLYCYDLKAWKRIYLTQDGICIKLIEDVTETGGQYSLWLAGIVMAKYLESNKLLRTNLKSKSLIELGAGAGLTSMVASVLGAHVYCTEQVTSLKYLRKNASFNPEIELSIGNIGWDKLSSSDNIKFDMILGCDITYELKSIPSIVKCIHSLMKSDGEAFICHDNDSCPMSKYALKELESACSNLGLAIKEIDYKSFVDFKFHSDLIKLWSITFLKENQIILV